VDEADDAPGVLVLAGLAGEVAHDGLDREAVLAQAIALGVLAEKVPGSLTVHGGWQYSAARRA
jgi:hypothetical protein